MGSTDFNGTTSYLRTTNVAITGGSISLVAWINFDGAGEGGDGTIIDLDTATTFLRMDGATSIRMAVDHVTTNATARMTASTLTAGVWYCVAGVYDAADLTCRLYFGTEYTQMVESTYLSQIVGAGAFVATNTALYVGGESSTPAATFDGRIMHPAALNWKMDRNELERYRKGDLTVLFARGNPHLYFTCADSTATADSSRRGGTVASAALTASSSQPVGVQFDWSRSRQRVGGLL